MRFPVAFFCLCVVPAWAWQPVGGVAELAERTNLARLRPGVQAAGFSSYDRTGLNNDGFQGTYSKLREEDGDSVLAEMSGPGCIQRIWFTHSIGDKPGLLELKGEHIRIYIDGEDAPALDVPLQSLFDGSLERFPQPMAGEGLGGFYCYVPIAYKKSCKVVVDGLGVKFYQINYSTFPSAKGVKSFTMQLSKKDREALLETCARWRQPIAFLKDSTAVERQVINLTSPGRYDLNLGAIERNRESKPSRKRLSVVQGLGFEDFEAEEVLNTRIEIRFDGQEAPAIDLPLAMLLGETFDPAPFQSLYFGQEGNLRYFALPMPFRDSCSIRLKTLKPLGGALLVRREEIRGDSEEYGYLHAQYHENLPTNQDGVLHPFLKFTGGGHYVGTFMATDGEAKLPFWMEGDDIWTLDGEMRIHGTGSEDYFNCGWYALPGRLNGPGAFPTHGFPVYSRSGNTNYVTCYRWHAVDPVPFDRSIDVGIEHGEVNRFVANYRSAAFFYTSAP